MLQSAKIIGTDLATMWLIGAGVGIGVVLGSIVTYFLCSKYFSGLRSSFNNWFSGLLDIISLTFHLALCCPPKPNGFTSRSIRACIECVGMVATASATVAALPPIVISFAALPIAISISALLHATDVITYDMLLDAIADWITTAAHSDITPGLAYVAQIQAALGIDMRMMNTILDSFIISEINQALVDGTLFGSISDNFHTITQRPVALVQYQHTDGVHLNWLDELCDILDRRSERYPGNTFLRQILNFRRP